MHLAVQVTIGPILFSLVFVAAAAGQSPQTTITPNELQSLDATLTAETLADLPLAENIYSALETTQPEVIADRFNSSGLNVGEPARVGGFLGSWSQTLFRIGDVDITDPVGSGAPLLFPELLFWQQVHVGTGLMPSHVNVSGLATTLEPRRPSPRWITILQGSGSGGGLAAPAAHGVAPPVARLRDWGHSSALVSGPLIADRLGLVAGGTWTRAAKFLREAIPAADSNLESGFIHLVYTPSEASESRTVGWVQRGRVPLEYGQLFEPGSSTSNKSAHLQSTWERRSAAGLDWRLLGGVTARSGKNDIGQISSIVADRLFDGPIPSVVATTGDRTAARWTLGARVAPHASRGALRHVTEAGLNLDRALVRTSDQFAGTVGELVDSVPARVWSFTHPQTDSRRHATTIAAFASDRISFSPELTLDAAIRFESITGSAEGATNGVHWQTWLPRAVFRWKIADEGRMTFVAGYRRSANQLNLNLLSFGDPAESTGVVTRWLAGPLAAPAALAAIIDRVGPGTGGNPAFSGIDPELKRPATDEYVVGLESRRRGWLQLGLTGIARRETNLVGVVDVGVPIASYSTLGIPDPGHDFASADDDQILTVYNRLPSSYGRNQYLLTNPGQQAATAYALKLSAQGSTDRLFLLFGATASAANGSAGSRGYGPLENDQDAAGELFTDPNAATYARGRLFSDRAFTIKWTTVYRFPGDIHVGAIARYQDGQPFARLVLAPGLNQGPELIRAYPNGGNRFTFTGTLDVRVQKGFTIARTRMDAIVDFYNLATRSNEVEEYTVTGPQFRTPTAIEPPHSIHLGARVTF
jgi:hypothetical protein